MDILKICFLFIAVLFTISNVGKIFYKNEVAAANLVWQAIGIVGFITLQFNLL